MTAGRCSASATSTPLINQRITACHSTCYETELKVPTTSWKQQSCLTGCVFNMYTSTIQDLHDLCSDQNMLVTYLQMTGNLLKVLLAQASEHHHPLLQMLWLQSWHCNTHVLAFYNAFGGSHLCSAVILKVVYYDLEAKFSITCTEIMLGISRYQSLKALPTR